MNDEESARRPELLLDEWLQEPDAWRAREKLEVLIAQHVEPLIRRIVGFKLGNYGETSGTRMPRADVEDVCQNALYSLLSRLDRWKSGEGNVEVRDFRAYAAVTAYNACNEYYRSRRPAWLSLSMKVRYLATHSPKFALWMTDDGREACGFADARGQEPLTDPARIQEECARLRGHFDASRAAVTELVEALLEAVGRPLPFEVLVDTAAELSGLQDERMKSLDQDAAQGGVAPLPDNQPAMDAQLIHRDYIRRLWREIRELPLEHRKALLLNLNDAAGGDIRLFDSLGIASVRQIAEVLEMDAMAFAAMWNDLPLDDTRIGQLLGLSRQDVANRRSAARKRLSRRMQEAI